MITKEQLQVKTVRELRVLCREWGILFTYRMKKQELIDVLWEHLKQFLPDKDQDVYNKNEKYPASTRIWRIRKGAGNGV